MPTHVFHIPKISCGHCTRAIQNELNELAGVTSVLGDIQNKTVTVTWNAPLTEQKIRETLSEINYPAVE